MLWSKRLGAATWDLLFVLIERFGSHGASAMFESNFYPETQRDRIRDLVERYSVTTFEVHCSADPAVLKERIKTRERHRIHHMVGVTRGKWWKANGPLELGGPLLRLDTSGGERVDLEAIANQIKEAADGS